MDMNEFVDIAAYIFRNDPKMLLMGAESGLSFSKPSNFKMCISVFPVNITFFPSGVTAQLLRDSLTF